MSLNIFQNGLCCTPGPFKKLLRISGWIDMEWAFWSSIAINNNKQKENCDPWNGFGIRYQFITNSQYVFFSFSLLNVISFDTNVILFDLHLKFNGKFFSSPSSGSSCITNSIRKRQQWLHKWKWSKHYLVLSEKNFNPPYKFTYLMDLNMEKYWNESKSNWNQYVEQFYEAF